jgi:hypothetical protein
MKETDSREGSFGMYQEHKQAISRGVSRFMTAEAKRRQCPACGRKAALGRQVVQSWAKDTVGGQRGGTAHHCFATWRKCRYCQHEVSHACVTCGYEVS